jgi:hypothetical protein
VIAAEVLPQPEAMDAVVWTDVVSRVLTVRLPDAAGGYESLLWRDAWQALRQAQEAGWPPDAAPWVYADLPGGDRSVAGQPGEAGTLVFRFPPGAPGFAALISKPGVVAIVTADRSARRFMACRFLNRLR